MPINTDLNVAPYFDDFDQENQFYRVLFKPGYAVQARELTQLQTMLQNQVESFGDNIFKEGSIVKGCTFTNLSDLEYVKVASREATDALPFFDPEKYVSKQITTEGAGGIETVIDVVYVLVGQESGLSAQVIAAERGFETRPPNLNTFFIRYLNTTGSDKTFRNGERIVIDKYQYKAGTVEPVSNTESGVDEITVTTRDPNPTGKSFGISNAPGIVFQRGNFVFADSQILVVSKYTNSPTDVAVGFVIQESLVTYLQDESLYDNANGYKNENAPGADRLKLLPILTRKTFAEADADATFFSLVRYENGSAVSVRDVSQYNVLGDVTARRTYEESGNYILRDFPVDVERNYSKYSVIGDIADVNVVGDPQTTLGANFSSAVNGDAVRDLATDDLWYFDGTRWHQILLQANVGAGVAYVKGYRAESLGTQSFEIEPTTNTEIQTSEPISFNYGNYVDVTAFNGYIDIDLSSTQDLLDSGDVKIGECFVSNLTPTRAYIFGVSLNAGKDFSDVAKIDDSSTGDITVGNVLKGTDKRSFIFDTGKNYLKDVPSEDLIVPIRGQATTTVNSNSFTLQASPDTDFAVTQHNILVVTTTGVKVTVTNTSTQLNNSRLTVTLQNGVVSDGQSVVCYYDYRAIDADVRTKTVKEPYIRLDHVTTRTRFTLGFPDVYEIQSIVNAAGDDFTKSFKLNKNQKDQFYDLSSMEYIQGRPRPGNEQLRIQLKVFKTEVPVGSESFYSISSYPTTLLPSEIPVYISESGRKFNLRDCFDFRPQVSPVSGMDYDASNPATAPVITAAIQSTVDSQDPAFTGTFTLPAVEQFASADVEYYLPRYDVITVDSYGKFNYIKGREEREPTPPILGTEQLVISEIFVPGYPMLSPKEASAQFKREYAVKAKPKGVKRYTMKDIQSIEERIDRLVYYTSLNQLEQETNNLSILDENGLSRFKNGFIVDPFDDLQLANVQDPKFDAAVHFNQSIMTPSVRTFDLNLKYKTSNGATVFPATGEPIVGTLSRNAHVSIINQPYATGYRNCVSNFYNYKGQASVFPSYDATYDTTVNPVEINFESAFSDMIDNIQRVVPLTDVRTTNIDQRAVDRARANGGTVRFTETSRSLVQNRGNAEKVGDFVTNFQFKPYMAPRDISIYVSGLRPNTPHYFFFDKTDVTANVCSGTNANTANAIGRGGSFGGGVSSDANGVLRAVFRLPSETFFVGDRLLEIADVDAYDEISSGATSSAKIVYRAYNFDVEKSSLSVRMPDFDTSERTSNRSVTFRAPPDDNDDDNGGGNDGDPLAQTFFIKRGMGRGSNTVAVSKLDLFFKRKSSSTYQSGNQTGGLNGVTVMLREVVNGYPSAAVLPFSKVHLEASDVNISDDASVATTIEFHAPIILETEKEYAFVVMPDANDPDYLIFTSQVGGKNLTPGSTQGQSVVQDWGDGVLFTSTNNRAWKSYQDEDVKFTLYRHVFNSSEGSVTLTNDDHEFFTVNDITAEFNKGELVYQESGVSQTVGIASGNNVITRTNGANFDTVYAIGDFIKIGSSSNVDIFEIDSVSPDTMTTTRNSEATRSADPGIPVVTGNLAYYNVIEPEIMYLESSSARSSKVFSVGGTLTGLDSGATADIVSIDNIELSYVQPFISRVNDSATKTDLSGKFIPPAAIGTTYDMPMKFNGNNDFNKSGVLIYSKTNNLNGSLLFEIKVDMENDGNTTSSPLIDLETSKLLAYKYNIANTSDQTSNFISKTVELAEDFDAEDFNLILTGYRPAGTEIKTYIRAQNIFDTSAFDELEWVELEIFEGVETFSSSTNLNDYREYRYRIAEGNPGLDGTGVFQYVGRAGTYKTFRKFAIRIELLSPNVYQVPRLKDYRGIALT